MGIIIDPQNNKHKITMIKGILYITYIQYIKKEILNKI